MALSPLSPARAAEAACQDLSRGCLNVDKIVEYLNSSGSSALCPSIHTMTDVFKIAMWIENQGNALFADALRKEAFLNKRISPASVSQDDEHFLTPKLQEDAYPVGVASYYLEDRTSGEETSVCLRRLEIEVFYPGVKDESRGFRVQSKPGFQKHWTPQLDGLLERWSPAERQAHEDAARETLNNQWTRSQPRLEPARVGRYPIIIITTGYGCNHDDYSHYAEELASRGFCVITINHPHSNRASYFLGEDETILDAISQEDVIERNAHNRVRDIEIIIRRIREGTIEGFHQLLGEHLDIDKIGVCGHSLGGFAAAQLPYVGVNLDGPMPKTRPSSTPFLLVKAGPHDQGHPSWSSYEAVSSPLESYEIEEALHMEFTLGPAFADKALRLSPTESHSPHFSTITQKVHQRLLQFFNHHLRFFKA